MSEYFTLEVNWRAALSKAPCFFRRLKFKRSDWLTVALETYTRSQSDKGPKEVCSACGEVLCCEMAVSLFCRGARLHALKIPFLVGSAKRFESSFVETEQDGKIFLVSIARPEKRNAVNAETAKELADAFRNFEIDNDCKVAVFYGKGDTFCAGYDLEELSERNPDVFLKSVPPVGEGDAPMVK